MSGDPGESAEDCSRSRAGEPAVGLARNARLEAQVEYAQLAMQDQYEQTGTKQRLVDEFSYAAQSWPHERRVITRLEWGEQGCNPRFVVTNLDGDAQALYDDLYCQRGEAENRIKEAQVGLFATRTSYHVMRSNQLRMLLAALGYVLIERLRALALQGTALASAQVDPRRGGGCHRPIALNTRRRRRNDIQAAHRATKPASTQPFNPHSGRCVKYPG